MDPGTLRGAVLLLFIVPSWTIEGTIARVAALTALL
jgi:hypothetical protein